MFERAKLWLREQLKPIPLKDSLTLSSWEKWQRYHRFPWKLLSDTLVLVLCVTLVLLGVSQTADYSHASQATLQRLFHGGGVSAVYSASELATQLQAWATNYWNLSGITLSRFGHLHGPDGLFVPPRLVLTRYVTVDGFWNHNRSSYDNVTLQTTTETYALSRDDPLGPVSIGSTDVIDLPLLQSTLSITLKLQFLSLNTGPLGSVVYRWVVDGAFVFTEGGAATFSMVARKVRYQDVDSTPLDALVSLTVVLFFVSLFSLVLSARALHRGYRNMAAVRTMMSQLPPGTIGKYTSYYTDWTSLPSGLKAQFFSFWNVWNAVGCAFVVVGCVLTFVDSSSISDNFESYDVLYSVTMGLGTFMSCVNWVSVEARRSSPTSLTPLFPNPPKKTRYLELSRRFHVLVSTMRMSFSRVVFFTLSVLPLFFGFQMLGLALFAPYSERWSSLDQVGVTLFSLANGDEMHGTYADLDTSYPWGWIARVYLYTYILLFITAIMNVFIFIIEDAFEAAKTWNSTQIKEREEFKLVNLVAILEIEGQGLMLQEDGTWMLKEQPGKKQRARDYGSMLVSSDDLALLALSGLNELSDVSHTVSTRPAAVATAKPVVNTETEPLLAADDAHHDDDDDDDDASPTSNASAAATAASPPPLTSSITRAIEREIQLRKSAVGAVGRKRVARAAAAAAAAKDKEEDEQQEEQPTAAAADAVAVVVAAAPTESMEAMVERVVERVMERMHQRLVEELTRKGFNDY